MLQVRKSLSCGISAIFFQCCFMVETQVLLQFLIFQGFPPHWGISFDERGGSKKIVECGARIPFIHQIASQQLLL